MRFDRLIRNVGPIVAMAAMSGAMANARKNGKFEFKWDGPDFTNDFGRNLGADFADKFGGDFTRGFGTRSGVPLHELDMADDVPDGLVLAGADHVVVTRGEDFAIAVQGDDAARDSLRFQLKDGTLHVSSQNSSNAGEGIATVTVTMPEVRKVTIAGSGQITLDALTEDAEVVIAGSGRVRARNVAIDQLDLTIAGSGRFKASGTAHRMDLTVAGSGQAKLGQLTVDTAHVTLAGSGSATFCSDGEVKARLMGSGKVTVRGNARCKVQGMGSGSLVCERRDDPAPDSGEHAA